MTSSALEAVTPIGAAEANDAPRSECFLGGCAGVRREDDMGATGAGAAQREHVLRHDASAAAGWPPAHGLYDPALEKDSCGVGFIADIKGRRSHKLIKDALAILCN